MSEALCLTWALHPVDLLCILLKYQQTTITKNSKIVDVAELYSEVVVHVEDYRANLKERVKSQNFILWKIITLSFKDLRKNKKGMKRKILELCFKMFNLKFHLENFQ